MPRTKQTLKSRFDAVNGQKSASKVHDGGTPNQGIKLDEGTMDKIFPCAICARRFASKQKVQKHMPACVNLNGNPDGKFWDDAINAEQQAGPAGVSAGGGESEAEEEEDDEDEEEEPAPPQAPANTAPFESEGEEEDDEDEEEQPAPPQAPANTAPSSHTTPDPIVQILYGAIAPITGQTTRSLLEILRTWEDYRPVMWREPRNVQEARSELQVRGVVDEEGEVVVDEEMLDMGF